MSVVPDRTIKQEIIAKAIAFYHSACNKSSAVADGRIMDSRNWTVEEYHVSNTGAAAHAKCMVFLNGGAIMDVDVYLFNGLVNNVMWSTVDNRAQEIKGRWLNNFDEVSNLEPKTPAGHKPVGYGDWA